PITRTVQDNALVLQIIAGHDPQDPTSANVPLERYAAKIGTSIKGLRVGVANHMYLDDPAADPEQVVAIEQAVQVLKDLGATIVPCRLDNLAEINAVARLLLGVEGYAVHSEGIKTRPELYGRGTR